MLLPHVEAEIERLLALGRPQRAVARELGLSRGTVAAIAQGRRPADKSRHRTQKAGTWQPATRCPRCGGMTEPPCRACQVEPVVKAEVFCWHVGPLGVDLRGQDRARYDALHAEKLREGPPDVAFDESWPAEPPPDRDAPTIAELVLIETELDAGA